MKLVWTEKADADVDAIWRRRYSDAGARTIIRAIRRRARGLQEYPDMGRVMPEFGNRYVRELIEGDYRIIYERFADRVEVLAIIHGARSFSEDLD